MNPAGLKISHPGHPDLSSSTARMRILFIKPKHIGDTLLLTPTLRGIHQNYPDAEIWTIVRAGCEGILRGCPFIHRIKTVAAVGRDERGSGSWKNDLRLWFELRKISFDYLFELGDGHRGRWLALIARADRKYSVLPANQWSKFWPGKFTGISTFNWQTCHRIEKDYYSVGEFLKLPKERPRLEFDRSSAMEWPQANGLGSFAMIQIGSRQKHKKWSLERWQSVAGYLLERFGAVVASTGPDPDEVAFAEQLGSRVGPRLLLTRGQATWSQMAGLFYRASLVVTVDTAAMHLASACQCPTIALFARSIEDHWSPWNGPCRIVTVPEFRHRSGDQKQHEEIKERAITRIRAEDVIAACQGF
ncbi:MAG: putative lipopolysaccharide heptosyltransferase, partial [Verrucomicrobiales bacterium]|nr:putative lipopolysaccharide heptosyltransferase [Verrucomicrobiales bacterium]